MDKKGRDRALDTAIAGIQKRFGEGAIMPTIPAILNAVYDAAGVRIYELPLTPERVYTAIQEYKERKGAA